MEFFHIKKDIPFMSYGVLTTTISLITFILAIFFLSQKGLNLGIEFTGGTVIEIEYPESAPLASIRASLAQANYRDVLVQNFGSSREVTIRFSTHKDIATLSDNIIRILRATDNRINIKRVENIGAQVGTELYTNGLLALFLVCIGIMAYLALRFEWRFAVAAILANTHDVVIILGFFAFFQWEFDLSVLAGILAVLGYSVNESVVVFDRVRENFRKMRKANVVEIIDNAITSTMSRTIITHFCTQLMVLSMLIYGGVSLHNFSLALTIGILFGIYSSVLVACPIVLYLGISRKNLGGGVPQTKQIEQLS